MSQTYIQDILGNLYLAIIKAVQRMELCLIEIVIRYQHDGIRRYDEGKGHSHNGNR